MRLLKRCRNEVAEEENPVIPGQTPVGGAWLEQATSCL